MPSVSGDPHASAQPGYSFGVPALLGTLAVPMILRLVPPNQFYGFRTAWSLSSSENWYHANFVSGRGLALAGVLMFGLALGIASWAPEWSETKRLLVTVLLQTIMVSAALLTVVLQVEGHPG